MTNITLYWNWFSSQQKINIFPSLGITAKLVYPSFVLTICLSWAVDSALILNHWSLFLVTRHRAVNYIAICFAAQTDERHLQTKILSENSRVKCYWWLVELPYWFKATFLLKILGNLSNVRWKNNFITIDGALLLTKFSRDDI